MLSPAYRSMLTTCLVLAGALRALAADAPLFDYHETTLDNGLRVVTLEDFSCPIVNVQVWYHVGSKDEDPERQGFAHMFEHMMFRGTDRLGPTDHFDNIRRAGGECNAYTSFDNTTYHETLPSNQLELALWLEAERMSFLKIDQTAFDTERKVVEEERRLGLNRPYGTVPEKVLPEIFKEHPYRWMPIGRIPHLRAAAVQELRDFWTKFYVPNNATLVIVGAVKYEDAERLAKKYFGWIPRCPDTPRIKIQEPQPKEARSITIKEDSAPAPVTAMGWRTVGVAHDDYIPLQMLAMILGGGESSRLHRELVSDKQLAVAAIAAAFSLEQDGLFVVGTVMAPMTNNDKKVTEAVEAQIQRLRSEPVSERELTKARNQMLKGVVGGNLTVESKAQLLGQATCIMASTGRVNEQLDRIRRVTAADLQRLAQTYLTDDKVLRIKIEQNLLGTLLGKKKNSEEDAPVTAKAETEAPPPGRPNVQRPAGYPTTAPVTGLLDANVTPQFEEAALPNGLKILVVENHEVPFVEVSLGMLAGSWAESKPGTASMTLSMLTKGTAKHSDAELADELETYGISLGGSGGMDSSTVSADCLPEQLDRALSLMAEVVLTPTFPADEFEKHRKLVRTGLAVSSAEPAYLADKELRARLYGQHPYSRTATGELRDVDALTTDDLRAWWGKFARPDMCTLIFSGDIDVNRALELAKAHFEGWNASGEKPSIALPAIPAAASTKIYLVDKPGVQSQIRVAQPSIKRDDPGYFNSRVVSSYFGGAFNSRINESIRVKKGLTYGASGGYSAQRLAGTFQASTFSKTDSTVEAVKAIFEELQRLKAEPPTDKEMNDTKSFIVGSFPGDRETPQQVAGNLWMVESQALPHDYFQKLLAGVSATQRDDCMKLIERTVDPSKMVVVVVGSAEKLKEGLEKIAPVEVVKPAGAAASQPADGAAQSQ